jgi:hypothetical protein
MSDDFFSYTDDRMVRPRCPLGCDQAMRPVKAERHPWGEFGFYQCDSCGCAIDICNMVDAPSEFTLHSTETFESLRQTLKRHGEFERMPRGLSRLEQEAAKEEAKLEADESRVRCQADGCGALFNRAPSAKSRLTLDFCAPCRKKPEVREKIAQEEAEEKARKARNKKAARARAAKKKGK